MEFLSGLIGALVGGMFVLAGSWIQGWHHMRQTQAKFEHEREMAALEHGRQAASAENERMRARLRDQIVYGDKVVRAAGRFQFYADSPNESRSRADLLSEAVRFTGLNWDDIVPYGQWVHPDELEDEQLRQVVADHRALVQTIDQALMWADAKPTDLPADSFQAQKQLEDLARAIEVRCRQLQRGGSPL